MGKLIELRPIRKQKDLFDQFVKGLVGYLSLTFGPVYAKDAFAFGFPLVPFFEKRIFSRENGQQIHPWIMTIDGNIDLHLTGTMVISVREHDAAVLAEIVHPRITEYSDQLRSFSPEEALWLNVIINQISDQVGLGDRC